MKISPLRVGRLTWVLVVALSALLLAWGFFRQPIRRALSTRLLLRSEAPTGEFFREVVRDSADKAGLLRRCWDTGRIVQRVLVEEYLSESVASEPALEKAVQDLVLAGAVDVDVSVRELALATLEALKSPRLLECCRAQLSDTDPMLRLLGLQYLRKTGSRGAVPLFIRLLDDSDPRVAAEAEIALMRWSGQDFGVRVRMAIPAIGGPGISSASREELQQGIRLRKEWWKAHAQEYAEEGAGTPGPELPRPALAVTPDFKLKDLSGNNVSLSDFRGKPVLLNFWTTWCTACQEEIPDLVALQQKHGDRIVVLGISLDGVPDEHGDNPGGGAEEGANRRAPASGAFRGKLENLVKARGINYPVLWDSSDRVGSRFNGGELPTTVLIDSLGRTRRRFVGARSLEVFEAMLAELGASSPRAK